MSAGVYPVVQSYVCELIPYSACLQVYAIQRSVCVHAPYIALVCWRIPYHTELCLQAYTVQCLSAGVCNTALCLRACTIHRLSVGVYRIVQSYVCKLIPYSACLRDYAIHLMSAGMYHTSRLSVGVYRTVQRYVCKRIPYSACLRVYAIQRYVCGHVPYIVLVCRCMPYRAMTAGVCV